MPAVSAACRQMVRQRQDHLGSGVRLDVERVVAIPPEPSGKTHTFISRVTRLGEAPPTPARG